MYVSKDYTDLYHMSTSSFKQTSSAGSSSGQDLSLAFVIPWFGEYIGGGAEAECRQLVKQLVATKPTVKIEVITTTLKEFSADWNVNVHKAGLHSESGIAVRRFKADPHPRTGFGPMNDYRLAAPILADLKGPALRSPLTPEEENFYLDCMVHSADMYDFLASSRNRYDYFIFMPYMFGTTVRGSSVVGDKAVIIPCLHDERYAYMDIYKNMMRQAAAGLFHVKAEMQLANRLYGMKGRQLLLGEMVDTTPVGDAARFREKYSIQDDFIIYSGRKIKGKHLPMLVDFFERARQSPQFAKLKLVLMGKGELDYSQKEGVVDLGFIPVQDKHDAFAAAKVLCQPSQNESFSIVMMESWLQQTPCLVNAKCDVTVDHCKDSGGGLWFENFDSFTNNLNSVIENEQRRREMGKKGREYVLNNYAPPIITERLVTFLNEMKGGKS
ncbi:MAG: glycosyltransferase family 4 protein [Oligoflexales bacterium]